MERVAEKFPKLLPCKDYVLFAELVIALEWVEEFTFEN
jgi:hypothetical protein